MGTRLIPSDYSSGAPRRQGSIAKAGIRHARKALVESAGADRDPATGSVDISNCDSKSSLTSSRTSVGKRNSGWINATDDAPHEVNPLTGPPSPWPVKLNYSHFKGSLSLDKKRPHKG